MMSNEPTADDLARALTGLMDAHREYDRNRQKAMDDGDQSWDWTGRRSDEVYKAHNELTATLDGYIDARVRAVLQERING